MKTRSLLDVMSVMFLSLFVSKRDTRLGDPYQPKAPISKGEVHITSYGSKPVYGRLPRKKCYAERNYNRRKEHLARVLQLDSWGILWTPHGLYWKTKVD
jgi:hypothetical protein